MTPTPHAEQTVGCRSLPARVLGLLAILVVAALPGVPAAATSWRVAGTVASLAPTGDAWEAVYDEQPVMGALGIEFRPTPSFALSLFAGSASATGQLVAVLPNGEVVPTGGNTSIDLLAAHLTAAWVAFPAGRWQLLLGGGPSWLDWDESNEFSSVSGSKVGYHLSGGVRRVFERVEVGVVTRWFSFSQVFPDAGAAGALNDRDFGGVEIGLVFAYRFGGGR